MSNKEIKKMLIEKELCKYIKLFYKLKMRKIEIVNMEEVTIYDNNKRNKVEIIDKCNYLNPLSLLYTPLLLIAAITTCFKAFINQWKELELLESLKDFYSSDTYTKLIRK